MKPLYLKSVEEMLSRDKDLSDSIKFVISKKIYNVDDHAYIILFDLALIHNNFDEALSIMEKAIQFSMDTNCFSSIHNNPKPFIIRLNKAKEKFLKDQQ